MKRCRTVFLALILILFCGPGYAQETGDPIKSEVTTDSGQWNYLAEIYLMFPNMSGQTTVGNIPPIDVDASAGDIFGHLEMGAMLYFEANNGNWAIGSDLLYMKLGQDVEPGVLVTNGKVTVKQLAWEISGLKRLTPWLEAGLAGRLVSLNLDLEIETINQPRSGSGDKTWFDPVVVLRSNHVLNEKWLAQLRVDAGGFGIGSDFTWQLQANAGYRFSDLFQASLGYRYIGIDYDSGEGRDRFLYDIDTYGFVLRLGFNF